MTVEQIIKNNHIPTAEVEKDLADTLAEIDGFEQALKPLRSNPVQNRLEIYLLEGKISKRNVLVNDLIDILKYRRGIS